MGMLTATDRTWEAAQNCSALLAFPTPETPENGKLFSHLVAEPNMTRPSLAAKHDLNWQETLQPFTYPIYVAL